MSRDPMELVARLEKYVGPKRDNEIRIASDIREAAACIREMVEQKPFAHFQWNDGGNAWEQVVPKAAGQPHVVAAYRLPLLPAPGAEA